MALWAGSAPLICSFCPINPNPANDDYETLSNTSHSESESPSAPQIDGVESTEVDDVECIEDSYVMHAEQEVIGRGHAQQPVLQKQTTRPPGEWWKANVAHAINEEKLTISTRPNVISTNDMLDGQL